jgi:hypothetical protein
MELRDPNPERSTGGVERVDEEDVRTSAWERTRGTLVEEEEEARAFDRV